MRRDLFVYVSGPMSPNNGRTLEENLRAGIEAHLWLLHAGIPNFCPHLSGYIQDDWHCLTWNQWLAYDYAVLDRCTHVVLLDGWERSTGARCEKAYAERTGKPVIRGVEAMIAEAYAMKENHPAADVQAAIAVEPNA